MTAIFTSQVSTNTFVMLSIAFAAGFKTLMRRSRLLHGAWKIDFRHRKARLF